MRHTSSARASGGNQGGGRHRHREEPPVPAIASALHRHGSPSVRSTRWVPGSRAAPPGRFLIGQPLHDPQVDRTFGELASTIELEQQPVHLIDDEKTRAISMVVNARAASRRRARRARESQQHAAKPARRARAPPLRGWQGTRPARRTQPPSRPAGRASSRSSGPRWRGARRNATKSRASGDDAERGLQRADAPPGNDPGHRREESR